MIRMAQKRDANGASVLVPNTGAHTVKAVTCATYITMRASALKSAGMGWPSYGEFLVLYGVGKEHSVADIVDYVGSFV